MPEEVIKARDTAGQSISAAAESVLHEAFFVGEPQAVGVERAYVAVFGDEDAGEEAATDWGCVRRGGCS